jgi:hypothetical protein
MKSVRYNIMHVQKSKLRRLWDFIISGGKDDSKYFKKLSDPIEAGSPLWKDADIEAKAYWFGQLGWRVKTRNLKTGEMVELKK